MVLPPEREDSASVVVARCALEDRQVAKCAYAVRAGCVLNYSESVDNGGRSALPYSDPLQPLMADVVTATCAKPPQNRRTGPATDAGTRPG
jgi:hypothetical protein